MAKRIHVDGDAGAKGPDPMANDPQDPAQADRDGSAPRPGQPETLGRSPSRGSRSQQGSLRRRAAGLHQFFTRELWSRELATLPTFRRWAYGVARVVQLTGVNFVKDRCSWRASALTYITVLSLVPMLAFAFSVAKGMGAYEQLQDETIIPFLDRTFPTGGPSPEVAAVEGETASADEADEKAADADGAAGGATDAGTAETGTAEGGTTQDGGAGAERTEVTEPAVAGGDPGTEPEVDFVTPKLDGVESEQQPALEDVADAAATAQAEGSDAVRQAIDTVLGFVEDTDVSRLGALGFLIVLWTVIKLLGSVELSFNDIWGVRKSRSLPRKIADYFSTVILVPLLLVTGTTVTRVAQSERFGFTGDGEAFAQFSSFAVVWLGFAFAYILMPNTRIRVSSALVGGVVGGTMWQIFQWAHLELQVGVAKYNAIYSTFAALPIFLFWVQSSWMTVLLGAEAAAAHQNQARHGQLVRSRDYDLAQKEGLALRLMARITQAFMGGTAPHRSEDLAEELGCPDRTLEEVTRSLESAGILAVADSDDQDPTLVLAKDPGIVRLQDVLDALKGDSIAERDRFDSSGDESLDGAIETAFQQFRAQRDAADTNMTLRELALVRGVGPGAAAGGASLIGA